ncbi:hypothetical protein CCAND95_100023 [Capnocytophaga canis]|uniref:Uncharacterized protein n=1 Tax=Capnocytophaga canis TaxID=1848903 RepID=A0A0B7I9L5_9FLAO|nr:hypothetical protein CCAND95_100023 [Capnocytophaga canis]CEN46578.1 hypothetical protein CCAND38_370023 [Capnocytophaga canis]CEN51239.1 hypothetical protein CCAND93_150011 [Capnocytophaga canis]
MCSSKKNSKVIQNTIAMMGYHTLINIDFRMFLKTEKKLFEKTIYF